MNRAPLLFINVFVIATCGLIYELLAGTLASYVLGDSVTHFSVIIGLYLFAMGIGAWLSRFVGENVAERFIEIELAVAILGGFSAPLLFFAFAKVSFFSIILYSVVFCIGTLVGLEIPLIMRILKDELDFKELVAKVLTFDYIGALAASLLFPLFLVPQLGLVRTSLIFGMANAAVGIWGTSLLANMLSKRKIRLLQIKGFIILTLLIVAVFKADTLTVLAEEEMFSDSIIYAKSSKYQRIVVTRSKTGFSLFLNGNLQFNSFDEYRYHEALVHPAMASYEGDPKRVLVLGGGDGLALREVLKYKSVEEVLLIDLDPEITVLSKRINMFAELNKNSLSDPRVSVINDDAFVWLSNSEEKPYDVVIIDFPDPNNFTLGKLYSTRFYTLLKQNMRSDSIVVIQSTSPLYARNSFWCIAETIEASGFKTRPYQNTVPSFGIWGYVLAKQANLEIPRIVPNVPLKYLDKETMVSMFEFPRDASKPEESLEINRLDNQALVRYYEEEWRRFE